MKKEADTITVGFRVDAGGDAGYGHIMRCLVLAKELRRRGCLCWFWGNNRACCVAARNEFASVNTDEGGEHDPGDARIWVVDLPKGCPPIVAGYLRKKCDELVILNGVGHSTEDHARKIADLVFYQGLSERPYNLDWDGFTGQWYEGEDWVIIDPAFTLMRKDAVLVEVEGGEVLPAPQPVHDPLRVFVCGGGGNIGDISGRIVRALGGEGYALTVVRGMEIDGQEIDAQVGRVEWGLEPIDMAAAMASCDIAVVAYGMTALECACVGLPTLAISLRAEQLEGARLAETRSRECECVRVVNAGLAGELADADLQTYVKVMARFEKMRVEPLPAFIDGGGVVRVADEMLGRLVARRETEDCDGGGDE